LDSRGLDGVGDVGIHVKAKVVKELSCRRARFLEVPSLIKDSMVA
jgi:hypothetical protein